jgi:hypothetical protein
VPSSVGLGPAKDYLARLNPTGALQQIIGCAALGLYNYDEVEFEIFLGYNANAVTPSMQVSLDGGATWYNVAGGYHISCLLSYANVSAATYSGNFSWPGSGTYTYIPTGPANDVSFWHSGTIKFYGLNITGGAYRPIMLDTYCYSGGYHYAMHGAASVMGNGTQPTHIRFTTSAGTATYVAGSYIKVYGVR